MNAFLPLVLMVNTLLAPCAWGQNAPAAAPSGAGSGQTSVSGDAVDPRLDAPVTLRARRQPLRKIVQSLRPANGPEMRVGADLAWEQITVYAAKQPARQVMNSVRGLLNYAWIHDDSGPVPQWRSLVLLPRTRAYEADLRRQLLEQGAARLFQLTDYLKTPADEFMKLRRSLEAKNEEPKDPMLHNGNLYYLSKEHPRLALELLTTLNPAQRETLLSDGDTLLTWGELDAHQQELALGLAGNIQDDRSNSLAPSARPGENDLAWVKSFGLMLYVERDPLTGVVTGFSYGLGGERYAAGQPPQDLPMHDLFNVRGNPYRSHYGMHLPIYPRLEAQRFPAEFKLDATKVATWDDVLEELSRHLDLPIYSDSYTFMPTPQERSQLPAPDLQNCSLVAGLDALCNRYRYLWWYQDGALFFRSRVWFMERLYETPPPVLTLLRRKLAAGGALDVEALDALSGLTLQQLQGLNAQVAIDKGKLNLVGSDPHRYEIARGVSSCGGAYAYLQTYARLDPAQKERFLTAEGVPLTEVSPEIRDAFLRELFRHNFSDFRGDLTRLRLHATQTDLPSTNPESKTIHRLSFDDLPGMVQIAYDPPVRAHKGRP
jgi:hypothetical protein